MSTRTSVYIYTDTNTCAVLYVGMTGSLPRRDGEHRTTSAWREWATDRFAVEFSSREVARSIEALLIGLYQPEYNIQLRDGEAKCDIASLHPRTTADDVGRLAGVQRRMVSAFEESERRLRDDASKVHADLVTAGTVGEMFTAVEAA